MSLSFGFKLEIENYFEFEFEWNSSFIDYFRAFSSRVDYTIKTQKAQKLDDSNISIKTQKNLKIGWHIIIFQLQLEKTWKLDDIYEYFN